MAPGLRAVLSGPDREVDVGRGDAEVAEEDIAT